MAISQVLIALVQSSSSLLVDHGQRGIGPFSCTVLRANILGYPSLLQHSGIAFYFHDVTHEEIRPVFDALYLNYLSIHQLDNLTILYLGSSLLVQEIDEHSRGSTQNIVRYVCADGFTNFEIKPLCRCP